MRTNEIILLFVLLIQSCYAQTGESYFDLPSGTIKSEVATFVRAAVGASRNDTSSDPLIEIRLIRCSYDFVHFERGDWIALDKLVTISARPFSINTSYSLPESQSYGVGEGVPTTALSEVRYVKYKTPLILPDSAIAGLYNPNFCTNPRRKNKVKETTSSSSRVYQSQDGHRVYIYMLNSNGSERYEVTWIIEDLKYVNRIVDKV